MSFNISRGLLFISALAPFSASLPAVDGVTLIDQRTALAGRFTPGDAPGFPITISQGGSYRLASNLTVPDAATTAIHVTADNVTIDLNGFSIVGPNVCTPNPTRCTFGNGGMGVQADAPIGVVSPANVRVMNGTIRGMGGYGLRMMGDSTSVERVHAISNGGPGIVVGEGMVLDSVSKLSGAGTALIGLIVRGCLVSHSSGVGIGVRSGGVASGNTSNYNGGMGFSLQVGTTATGNTANNNGGFGYFGSCPSVLLGNAASSNGSGSYSLSGSCALTGNTP